MAPTPIKVDLHVHSAASNRPYSWFLRTAGSAECYTSVREVYDIATQRGMDLVTLSDHDSIEGALELCTIAPNTFISEELSARFPEDGCVMHAIVNDITEAQHRELQRLRSNIYELMQYIHAEKLAHFLCHPLSEVNRRLAQGHLERCLLMFSGLELINGTRDRAHEDGLRRIVAGITPETLARWAEQHPQTPVLNPEGRYSFVGGSDDHGRLAIARAYTSFDGEASGRGLANAMRAGQVTACGEHARAETLPHNIMGVLTGYLAKTRSAAAPRSGFLGAMTATLDGPELRRAGHRDDYQAELFKSVNQVLLGVNRRALAGVAEAASQFDLEALADRIPAVLKGLLMGLPFVLGSRYHARDRRSARLFSTRLGFPEPGVSTRILVLTDTIDDVNGVALGLRALAGAARQRGFDLRLGGLGAGTETMVDRDGIVRFPAIHTMRLPEYPEMQLGVPHLPALLHYLVDQRIDLVQCSTPGPVGLAGLLAARLTSTPVIGQYHTDVPAYASVLTGDPVVGAIVERAVLWFYRQLDKVLVPSDAIGKKLGEQGLPAGALLRVPRGVDVQRFNSGRRRVDAFDEFGLGDQPKVLYVGRLSREKGLDKLMQASAAWTREGARLVMVGDGPHRARLMEAAPPGVVFVGTQHGTRLAELYASSDVFVYPSETETFGNAIIEAQAAGLPVVVANRGAAPEHILEGVTGLAVDVQASGDLGAAVGRLLGQPAQRRRMGAAAEHYAQQFELPRALDGTLALYERILDELDEATERHCA